MALASGGKTDNREMKSHYVFVMFMNDDDRVERVVKIWNAHWALDQLGWI